MTKHKLNVLIDHILVSQQVRVLDLTIWKPCLEHKPQTKEDQVNAIKTELKAASDHFPVSAEVEL